MVAQSIDAIARNSDVVLSKPPSASDTMEVASAPPADAAKAKSPKRAAPKKQQKHLIR